MPMITITMMRVSVNDVLLEGEWGFERFAAGVAGEENDRIGEHAHTCCGNGYGFHFNIFKITTTQPVTFFLLPMTKIRIRPLAQTRIGARPHETISNACPPLPLFANDDVRV